MRLPRVLLVTGAYQPEISAAAVQCRAVAAALQGRAQCSVLTTAVDPALAAFEIIEDVPVYRTIVDVRSRASKAMALVRFARRMLQARDSYDIIHVHGFSQKNVVVSLLARLLRKPLVLTLHTSGQDEPRAIRQRGRLAYWALTSADLVLCVSPDLEARCHADLPGTLVRLTPNGVDTARFRPADAEERRALRHRLGWPDAQPVVLFVGFFSHDKRPDLLFRAWRRLRTAGVRAKLTFVGATRTSYYEIDESIAGRIRAESAASGCADDVAFVEPTQTIEQYFRAADLFVLPSIREAHPLALLEAMACGVPCVATRLAGATDALIEDGVNGRLFPADDEAALAERLAGLLGDAPSARSMGSRARETVLARYDIRRTADAWLSAYEAALAVHH